MATTTFSSAYAQRTTRGTNGRHVLHETFHERHGTAMMIVSLLLTTIAALSGGIRLMSMSGLDAASVALSVALIFTGGAMFTGLLIVSAARE